MTIICAYAPEPTGSVLDIFFSYNPLTGQFTHKTSRGGRSGGAGSVAGHQMDHGYIAIGLPGGTTVLAHRLAWLWMTGKWPDGELDHKNGDRADNRFDNLRPATRPQQGANGGLRITNTSGVPGVCFDKSRQLFTARIGVNSKTINLGRFATMDEAAEARRSAEVKYFGEFRPIQRDAWRTPCH